MAARSHTAPRVFPHRQSAGGRRVAVQQRCPRSLSPSTPPVASGLLLRTAVWPALALTRKENSGMDEQLAPDRRACAGGGRLRHRTARSRPVPCPPPMLRVCPVALLVTPWATERSGQLCGVSAGPHEGGRHGVPWPDGTPTSLAFLGSFLYVLMSPQAERLVLSKEYFLKPKMIPKAHKKKK